MMLRYLIEKEFKQLKRNSFLPRLILLFPCMMMLVMPWAATLEIENLRIAVIDNDRSPSSERLVHRIEASRYFQLTALPPSYAQGLQAIEKDQADMLLEIPRGFEKAQANGQSPAALIAVNTVNGTKGGLGSAYLQQILNPSSSQDSVRYRFNPYLNYKVFMVPALMTMILVLLCGFLPALNVVSEKEVGTIEQINVSPVSRFTFTLAKLLPYWAIGFVVLNLCMLLAWLVYGLTPAGNVLTIYLATLIFALVMSGLRAGHIQLLFHHAAGHVRHVVLHADFHPDERTVYPHQQHAGVGTRHHLLQSVALLYGNHAHGLPEGKRHL